jgi:hypothetical protein
MTILTNTSSNNIIMRTFDDIVMIGVYNVVYLVILGLYRDYRLTPCSIIRTCFTDLPVIVLLLIDICYQSSPRFDTDK